MTTEPMRNQSETTRRPLATGLTLLAGAIAVLIRLVPHPATFSPVGAMGIFGGAKVRGWKAYCLPIAVMVLSDVALWAIAGFDPKYLFHVSRIYVYGSFLVYVAIGRLLRDHESPLFVCGASLLGSVQFFVVTNFCDWLFQPVQSLSILPEAFRYSRDLSGLAACFAAGLPFFQGDSRLDLHAIFVGDPRYSAFGLLVGDMFFTFGLFVLNAVLVRKLSPARPSEASAAVQTTPG